MKAVQAVRPEEICLVEVEKPKLGSATSVIIKVKAAGICGSDIHISHGRNPYATYPRIMGHEVAGVIEEVGEQVTKYKVGDRVVVEPILYCGSCYPCRIGRQNVCENLIVYGVHVDGGFAEYMNVEERALHRLPDEISFLQGALVEPYTIGAQAVLRTDIHEGDICLVHGAGPIGLLTVDLLKEKGAFCLVSELSAPRKALAEKFGADVVIDPKKQDLQAEVKNRTKGKGVNVIFDAVGIPGLVEQSIPLLSAAGRFLEFGYGFGKASIDFDLMNKGELTVLGVRHQKDRFEPVLKDFHTRLDKVDMLRTDVFSLNEYREAFNKFEDKNSGACKVVFSFE